MTLPVVTPRLTFIGSGTRGPFSLSNSGTPIRVRSASALTVTRYTGSSDTTGTVLTLNTDYTVDNSNVDAVTLTLTVAQTVLAATDRLLVDRLQNIDQELAISTGGNLSGPALMGALDIQAEYMQELRRDITAVSSTIATTGQPVTIGSGWAALLALAVGTTLAISHVLAKAFWGSLSVGTYALARTLTGCSTNVTYNIHGGDTRGDGAGGRYYYDSSDTTTADNGAMCIVTADGGRLKRFVDGRELNVKWFKAKGDNSTDDTAAIQAALTYAQGFPLDNNTSFPADWAVYIPPGSYLLSSTLTCTRGVSIKGAGRGSTLLKWTAAGGISITPTTTESSIEIVGLNLRANTTACGRAIDITLPEVSSSFWPRVTMRDVLIDGGIFGNYWNNGVRITHPWYLTLDNVKVVGINNTSPTNWLGAGFEMTGAVTSIVNFQNCNVDNALIGYKMSAVHTEGVMFQNCTAVSCQVGYDMTSEAGPSRTGTATMTIASPAVVTWTAHGLSTGQTVSFTTSGALPTGVVASTTYYAIKIDANTFNLATSWTNAQAGTKITTTGSQSGTHTATSGAFGPLDIAFVNSHTGQGGAATSNAGCIQIKYATSIQIRDCEIYPLNTTNAMSGIRLESCSDITVTDNRIVKVGSPTGSYGIQLISCTNFHIRDNMISFFIGSGDAPVKETGTGSTGSIESNRYYNCNAISLTNPTKIAVTHLGTASGSSAWNEGSYVTQPNQFYGIYGKNAAQSSVTGQAQVVTITFDAKVFDSQGAMALGTGIFTAPVAGYYVFDGVIGLNGIDTSHTTCYCYIVSTIYTLTLGDYGIGKMFDSAGFLDLPFSRCVPMAAGDTAKIRVRVDNGANVNVGISTDTQLHVRLVQ